MTKMRVRPGYSVNTRSHSFLQGSVFGAPSRLPLSDVYAQRSLPYNTRSEEYSIGDSVLRATSFSDAVLDDNYETSAKSRNRDQRLLSEATNAIVSSESHASPGSAVASRRARVRPQPAPRPVPIKTRHVVTKVAAISLPASKLELSKARPNDNKRIVIIVQDRAAPKPLFVNKPTRAQVPMRVIEKYGAEAKSPAVITKRIARKASAVYIPRRTVAKPPAVTNEMVDAKASAVYLPRRRVAKLPVVIKELVATEASDVYLPRRGVAKPAVITKMADIKASAVYVPRRRVAKPAVITKMADIKASAVYVPRRGVAKPAVITKMADIKASAVYVPRRTGSPVLRVSALIRAAPAYRRLGVVSTYRATRLPYYYYIARSRSLARSPLKTVQRPNVHRKPRKRAKAALVASTVEVEPRRRRHTPHSQYAADKLRETRRPGDQDSYVPTISTATLHASRPPFPLPTDRKSIRDVDGFTKPRNILSWQYRLESRVNPKEVMYKPGAYSRMREQVRDAHDKLDRHRQLLDRYLNESGEVYPQRSHKVSEIDEAAGGSSGRSSRRYNE